MNVWLARVMAGRYGVDQFSRFLSLAVLVLVAVRWLAKGGVAGVLTWLIWALLLYSLFRVFSRNIGARQAENRRYLTVSGKIRSLLAKLRQKGGQQKTRVRQEKTHVFFTCPKCQAQLRVPRGRGGIEITCARCGHRFRGKS